MVVVVSACCAVAVTLAGCSSGTGSTKASTTGAPPGGGSGGSGNGSAGTGPSAALAARLLKISDFPAGWSVQGQTQTGQSAQLRAGFLEQDQSVLGSFETCVGSSIGTASVPQAASPNFDGTGQVVHEIVSAYPTAAAAAAAAAPFGLAGSAQCMATTIGPVVGQRLAAAVSGTLGNVTGTPQAPPAGTTAGSEVQLDFPISAGANHTDDYETLVTTAVGSDLVEIAFGGSVHPFPADQIAQYTALAASRFSS